MRPKRQVRPPAWLEDYDVSLPHYDEPSPVVQTTPLTTEEQEPYHRIERVAEMTPLTLTLSTGLRQSLFTHSGQVEQMYESNILRDIGGYSTAQDRESETTIYSFRHATRNERQYCGSIAPDATLT